ncbi:hypothetical protein LCGC14_1234470 [marine sediment metagenome]|uniref:3D domain-containing protein n=1 Tax=marine sediment metagenome TaxID=412755 RepID=A0A0F9NPS9_9ZZZZ
MLLALLLLGLLTFSPVETREAVLTIYVCQVDTNNPEMHGGFCPEGPRTYASVKVQPGVAACSWDLPMGTIFSIEEDPTGGVYQCLDRGLLGAGNPTHVDVWCMTTSSERCGLPWLAQVGPRPRLTIILPEGS